MAIGHNHTVLANFGDHLRCGTAMHGHAFMKLSAIADFNSRIFTFEFEILRHGSNACAWENMYILTDTCTWEDGDIVFKDSTIANHCVIIYAAEWTDFYIFAYLSTFLDIGKRGYVVAHNFICS